MECNFVIGQKVVCVDDDLHDEWTFLPNVKYSKELHGLTKNEIYTIRDIYFDERHGFVRIRLVEINHRKKDSGYHHARFRPLRDLSVFHEILRKANAPSVTDSIIAGLRELSDINS